VAGSRNGGGGGRVRLRRPVEEPLRSVETTIYLAPGAIGRGFGSRLYGELLVALQALPIHAAMGGIALPNPASIALHEHCGFRKVGHFEQVGRKFGSWIDVGYWQRLLRTGE